MGDPRDKSSSLFLSSLAIKKGDHEWKRGVTPALWLEGVNVTQPEGQHREGDPRRDVDHTSFSR
jgi:hypothetical protein